MSFMKIATGARGEAEAVRLLKKNGYRILVQNYRCRYGEVDIIAEEGGSLVFIEVKTRSSDRFGAPAASVDLRKQRHIVQTSSHYLAEKGFPAEPSVRYDVVAVEIRDGVCHAEIIKNAFDAED